MRLIEGAEQTLDLQYFLIKPDLAAALVLSKLLDAADRGVRVRLLVDDVFTDMPDEALSLIDTHPNIAVRIFNPAARPGPKVISLITDFARMNRRMHNKTFTADGVVSIIGGSNIADEYFQIDTTSEFADFDMLFVGPAVQQIGASFDIYWNDDWAVPLDVVHKKSSQENLRAARRTLEAQLKPARDRYLKAVEDPYLQRVAARQEPIYAGTVTVVSDTPEKLKVPLRDGTRTVAEALFSRMAAARKEVTLITPYFVPEDYGARFFSELAQRGVKVTIVTNSLGSTNHAYVHAGYQRHRQDLLASGVALHEIRAESLQVLGLVPQDSATFLTMHAKVAVIDEASVFVGSLNMDPRSIKQNTEIGAFFDNAKFASVLRDGIEEGLSAYTYRLVLTPDGDIVWHYDNPEAPSLSKREPDLTFWKKFVIGVTCLIGIELQL